MAKTFDISFRFMVGDKLSGALGGMTRAFNSTAAASKKAANSVVNASNRMRNALSKVGSTATGVFGGLFGKFAGFFGAAGILTFANKSIELWKVEQAAIGNVQSAIKATGNAAGITLKRFQEMASSIQENSIFEDDSILQNVTAQLLTFNNIKGEKVFAQAQITVADLAARLDGANASAESLKGVSIMLGKVLQDPANMMSALARRGVIFSEAEQSTIKSLVAQNKLEKAQLFMLEAIGKAGYGGAAKDFASTDIGKSMSKKNKVGDLMEEIGKKLLPLKEMLEDITIKMLPVFSELVTTLGEILNALVPILNLFQMTLSKLQPVIKPLVLAIVGYHAALFALTIPMKIAAAWQMSLNIAFVAYMISLKALNVGMKIAAAAQWLWNASLFGCPILWIIAGVLALIAGIVLIATHWEQTKLVFQIGFAYIGEGFSYVRMKALDFLNAIGLVSDATAEAARIDFAQNKAEKEALLQKWESSGAQGAGRQVLNNKSQTDINIKVTGEKGATAIVGGVDRKSGNANINTRTDNGYTQPVLLGGGIY